jgi:hypothetical protein
VLASADAPRIDYLVPVGITEIVRALAEVTDLVQ